MGAGGAFGAEPETGATTPVDTALPAPALQLESSNPIHQVRFALASQGGGGGS
jgi:hypothetical protein